MAVTSVSLQDPVSGDVLLVSPQDGVAGVSLDVQPQPRAITEDRAGSHGQYDTTAYLSSTAVTLSLMLWTSAAGVTPEQFLETLQPFLAPNVRPNLVVTNDQWAVARQFTVRFDTVIKTVDNPLTLPVAISWVAINGAWEDAVLQTQPIQAIFGSGSGLDISYQGLDISTAGLDMPPSALPSGTETILTGGSVTSPWTALIYGPCSGPQLANDTVGQALNFTQAMVLNAGQFIAVDSRARTAYLNGDPTQPVLRYLDYSSSAWWLLQPGQNLIRYNPLTGGGGSMAQMSFRPAWMP